MNAKEIGRSGETAAAQYLCKKGYIIKERNFTRPGGEIDIIAEKDGCIVFVEVKTRKSSAYGYAAEYVTKSKAERVRNTALMYDIGYGTDIRFDVIEVYYREHGGVFEVTEIDQIEDAF